jgi:hypothetical protein
MRHSRLALLGIRNNGTLVIVEFHDIGGLHLGEDRRRGLVEPMQRLPITLPAIGSMAGAVRVPPPPLR